nr:immunoglobulin heavy chain junction region [Mus musculus]
CATYGSHWYFDVW